MIQSVLTLVPGGPALAQSLGFDARTVIVDNFTSSYVQLADAGKTIPPWTYGAVVAFAVPENTARAKLVSVTPAPAGPAVPVVQAVLSWTDVALPPDPGHLLQQSSYAQQQSVPGFPIVVPQDGNSHDLGTVNVPPGTHAIGFTFTGPGVLSSLIVHGQTSQINYADETAVGSFATAIVKVFSGIDSQVDIQVNTTTGAGSCTIEAVFIPDAQVVAIDPDTQVFLSALNSGPIGADLNTAGIPALAVSLKYAAPAPWEAASTSVTTRVAPGALNTDFTIRSGVGGQRIYVHDVVVNTNSGTTWTVDLWDGPSVNGLKVAELNMAVFTAVGASPPIPWDGRGRQLGVGNSLIGTLAAGAAASTIFGTYGLSQA